jgi:LuxR family maltose regulon positive regulatory protein
MVHRTSLLRQLRASRDHRIVSIVAPAGYGKTTVLAQWAADTPRSVAWLTADDGDNDAVVFLTYLAAALDRLEPLDPDIFRAIATPARSDRAVVGRLLAALQAREEPVLLVLDDAHHINSQACLDALAEFIGYLPVASQGAIASREPVDLPFARGRAHGAMLDIGPGDLAMDEREVAGMLRRHGLTLTAEATKAWIGRTEGWPALLALATLEARRSPGGDGRTASGGGLIGDYLRSELLERRTKSEVTFLTRTSILDHLTGSLCDAVVGRRGSAELLADLARSTLLVDEYGGSYRYHSLLRDFLRAELEAREPERVADLHERAAAWHQAGGAFDLAVDHAFAAGDLDHAAALVGKTMPAATGPADGPGVAEAVRGR